MKRMNTEIKKVVAKVKDAQVKLQAVLKKQSWVEDARKYAERQGHEVKKLLTSDAEKVKAFLERERKELERFQKEVPGEVKKLKNLLKTQSKEFNKLLATFHKGSTPRKKATVSVKKKSRVKSAGTKKKTSQEGSASSSSV